MFASIALAFGLAMDATAVCAARAFSVRDKRELAILPLLFGAAQAGMAALGWLGGRAVHEYIAAWDHWVAGLLLFAIGGKMIYDAIGSKHGDERKGSLFIYALLALATSIDAAAAGLTLHLLATEPPITLALIGGITAACCAVGYAVGRALGHKLGAKLEVIGALVLVAIGIDILIRAP